MEVQKPEKRPNEELKAPANTAASPEESKVLIQEPSKAQELESQPDPKAFSKDSEIKPYPESFRKDSHRSSKREGFSEAPDKKPYPEGFKQVSAKKPEGFTPVSAKETEDFNEESLRQPCLENLNKDSASKHYPEDLNPNSGSKSSTRHHSKRESAVYKPVDESESVLQELKDLESSSTPTPTPTPRTSSSTPKKAKSSRKKKDLSQMMCKCAASSAADCAAICCCPCVLAHVLIVALVKVPSMIARKILLYSRRKARSNRRKMSDSEDQDEDANGKKIQSYKSGWSFSTTPHFSGSLQGSPERTAEQQKEESQKFWQDLYADGHMGFGGPSLERD